MELTESQNKVLEKVGEFLRSKKIVFLIEGCAGSGKTTLVQHIIKQFGIKTIGVAYTHKAKRVLRQRMMQSNVMTLASLFSQFRTNSYIGAKLFDSGTEEKLEQYRGHVFILDEVSMVCDADFLKLKKAVQRIRGKILAIGDSFQIPAITQPLIEKDGALYKKECIVFSSLDKGVLSDIVRQKEESPILDVARYIRENIDKDFSIRSTFPKFAINNEDGYVLMRDALQHKKDVKIITYTNESVESHNRGVRAALGRTQAFEVGELLMGYQNIGYPKLFVENGADYIIRSVRRETNGLDRGLLGWNIKMMDIFSAQETGFRFFPDIDARENRGIISKLVGLAQKVNSPYSSKKDYAIYKSLKDKLLMISNVYEFPKESECFFSERELKLKEPLLFTQVADLLDEDGNLIESDLLEELRLLYGNLIDKRLSDDKALANGETFASAFCIFEKDLDYGYACTAHKAQGSTIDIVIVDEPNLDKIKNRYNKKIGMIEDKLKERNQLKYVACTRASETLYILCCHPK